MNWALKFQIFKKKTGTIKDENIFGFSRFLSLSTKEFAKLTMEFDISSDWKKC